MKVEVGTKKFDITKVSIYISELYGELAAMAYADSDLTNKLNRANDVYALDIEESETRADKLRAKIKLHDAIDEITKEGAEIPKQMYIKRAEVLKEILELNGYEYDEILWSKRADKELVNDILVEVIGGGSKKKAASST